MEFKQFNSCSHGGLMDALIVFALLALNVLISVWNCYAVGTAWKDTMAAGGAFSKFLLWSGLIQAAVGFSMPILLVTSFGAIAYLTSGSDPTITVAEGGQFLQWIFSLWYVAVIFPILGTGLAITAHSIHMAWQRRDLSSMATAGWNTYAQIHNTVSAVNHLGGAMGDVGSLFKGANSDDDSKSKLALLAVVVVVFALLGGVMIAFGLVKHFARQERSRLEEFAD